MWINSDEAGCSTYQCTDLALASKHSSNVLAASLSFLVPN